MRDSIFKVCYSRIARTKVHGKRKQRKQTKNPPRTQKPTENPHQTTTTKKKLDVLVINSNHYVKVMSHTLDSHPQTL